MSDTGEMRKYLNLLKEGWNDHVEGPGYEKVHEIESKLRDHPAMADMSPREIEDLAHYLDTGEDDHLDRDTFDKIYSYYLNSGEMPYGVAKARTGDPGEWIFDRLTRDIGLDEGIATAAAKITKPVVDTINKAGSAIMKGVSDDDDVEEACGKKHKRMKETAPKGWEKTVKGMKDEPEIDNPWALAHWMKTKGYKSRK